MNLKSKAWGGNANAVFTNGKPRKTVRSGPKGR